MGTLSSIGFATPHRALASTPLTGLIFNTTPPATVVVVTHVVPRHVQILLSTTPFSRLNLKPLMTAVCTVHVEAVSAEARLLTVFSTVTPFASTSPDVCLIVQAVLLSTEFVRPVGQLIKPREPVLTLNVSQFLSSLYSLPTTPI